MNRLNYIRQEEKKYHDLCYEQYKLFELVLGCTSRLKQLLKLTFLLKI